MMKKSWLIAALLILVGMPAHGRSPRYNSHSDNMSNLEVYIDDFLIQNSGDFSRWHDGHWAGVSINYNGLVGDIRKFALPEEARFMNQEVRSFGVNVNLVDVVLVHFRKVGLVSGIGFEFNNFRFEENLTLKRENGIVGPDDHFTLENIKLTKSKLYTGYLNIPLLVEVQIGPQNRFYINGGIVGGIGLGYHTKIKAVSEKLNGIQKSYDNLGLRNFHYGYTLGIGYDKIGVTATYYPTPIFKAGGGPKVRQVNIGISFLM